MVNVDGRAQFASVMNVSRETMSRLDCYEALIKKWNPSINLVAKSTLAQLWSRHFLDSAQILRLSRVSQGHWVDIGTGGGFPGLIIAAMTLETYPDLRFSFVESDLRKATFLRTAVRELGLSATVIADRAETTEPLHADVMSARALASLDKLLALAEIHLQPDGQAIFLKGAKYRKELSEALENWTFQSDEYPSLTDPTAMILSIGEIKRV
jgi:16S rRNA (guanine527-N7)-methyltransferase